jgi:hypothetical protein
MPLLPAIQPTGRKRGRAFQELLLAGMPTRARLFPYYLVVFHESNYTFPALNENSN